jgi:hypothetical protein
MKRNKKGGACVTNDWAEKYEVFVEALGKNTLGRPRHRWKSNTEKDFKEIW